MRRLLRGFFIAGFSGMDFLAELTKIQSESGLADLVAAAYIRFYMVFV